MGEGLLSQQHFDEFWRLAKTWRPKDTARVGAWAREFHRAVNAGVDPEEILRGARIYTNHHLPELEYPVSPQNWLIDWCWQAYQDEPVQERALTFEEQRSYERQNRVPPRTTNKPAGEWAGLAELRAVE